MHIYIKTEKNEKKREKEKGDQKVTAGSTFSVGWWLWPFPHIQGSQRKIFDEWIAACVLKKKKKN